MLLAIYKCGSGLLLDNPRDNDLLYIFETKEQAMDALIKNRDREKDIHFEWLGHNKIFLGCYAYPLMELLEGEEIDEFKKFSIFDHEEEYKDLLKSYAKKLSLNDKRWYHILVAIYMYENGKSKLNKTQLKKVQKVHDEKGIDQEVKKYIMEKLA